MKLFRILYISVSAFTCSLYALETPRVVFVIVVDQLSMDYINRLQPFLGHGLHKLFSQGAVYTNAHQPHGICVTAVGHAGIGTGALPKDHGITNNSWFDKEGVEIEPNKFDARYMLLPTLNQSFLESNSHNKAVAISLKNRAAIGMADDDAPAIWFKNNKFVTNTSDEHITAFLKHFNKHHPLLKPHPSRWELAYKDPRYYRLPDIDNYTYASGPSMFSAKNPLYSVKSTSAYFEQLTKLPQSNQLLLDLVFDYLKREYREQEDGSILIWVSLSSLDKMGHLYGPYSRETTDTMYHLDKQLQKFMNNVATVIQPQETLFVFTADHGVAPIPELLAKRGLDAHRIHEPTLTKKLNRAIQKKEGIANTVRIIDSPFVYFNQQILEKLSAKKQREIMQYAITYLQKIPGIKRVYQTRELAQMNAREGSVEWFLQNNIHPERSGELMILAAPFSVISKHPHGTKHSPPYSYDTHVPLIFYQPGNFESKTIADRVWVPQFNSTLARILHIPPASNKALPPLPFTVAGTTKSVKRGDSMAQKHPVRPPQAMDERRPALVQT